MKDSLQQLTSERLPEEWPEGYSGVQLTGDASTRSYYRITTPSGMSLILMKMPEPFVEADSPTF